MQAHNQWRNFLSSLFRTPARALVTSAIVIVIILSGLLRVLVSAFITNVFTPLAIIALLIALLTFIWNGGKRR
jgi:hypothetical protein